MGFDTIEINLVPFVMKDKLIYYSYKYAGYASHLGDNVSWSSFGYI